MLFNPNGVSHFNRAALGSKSFNTPFLDQTLAGQVVMVVLKNQILLDRTRA